MHDTEALYGLIHQVTGGFLLQILQLLGVGVMLFTINAKLAAWTLIPMPFVLILLVLFFLPRGLFGAKLTERV